MKNLTNLRNEMSFVEAKKLIKELYSKHLNTSAITIRSWADVEHYATELQPYVTSNIKTLPNTDKRVKPTEQSELVGIEITGRTWFDSINGNTYNATRIYIELKVPEYTTDQVTTKTDIIEVRLPFTYGYGDYYAQRAYEWIKEHFGFTRSELYNLNIYLTEHKSECRKSMVQEWGVW